MFWAKAKPKAIEGIRQKRGVVEEFYWSPFAYSTMYNVANQQLLLYICTVSGLAEKLVGGFPVAAYLFRIRSNISILFTICY